LIELWSKAVIVAPTVVVGKRLSSLRDDPRS